mmetsp:Transcript_35160/g.52276  ORF Transcript_35160/g.52276 Transcript_35160/m.52276 type:complete len:209 (+) Transcript_35160:699-1325(+)
MLHTGLASRYQAIINPGNNPDQSEFRVPFEVQPGICSAPSKLHLVHNSQKFDPKSLSESDLSEFIAIRIIRVVGVMVFLLLCIRVVVWFRLRCLVMCFRSHIIIIANSRFDSSTRTSSTNSWNLWNLLIRVIIIILVIILLIFQRVILPCCIIGIILPFHRYKLNRSRRWFRSKLFEIVCRSKDQIILIMRGVGNDSVGIRRLELFRR